MCVSEHSWYLFYLSLVLGFSWYDGIILLGMMENALVGMGPVEGLWWADLPGAWEPWMLFGTCPRGARMGLSARGWAGPISMFSKFELGFGPARAWRFGSSRSRCTICDVRCCINYLQLPHPGYTFVVSGQWFWMLRFWHELRNRESCPSSDSQ